MSESKLSWTELITAGSDWAYFSMEFDPEVKTFILGSQSSNPTLSCYNESYKWARKIKKQFPDALVEIVGGMYNTDEGSEGHTWVEVNGDVFDPTVSQFTSEGEYESHTIDEVE